MKNVLIICFHCITVRIIEYITLRVFLKYIIEMGRGVVSTSYAPYFV